MIDQRLAIAGLGAACLLVGVMVIRTQAKATSCPRHSRLAGRLAVPLGWASMAGGLVLLAYALFLLKIA